jgi:outer membrane protein assembly factor BamA
MRGLSAFVVLASLASGTAAAVGAPKKEQTTKDERLDPHRLEWGVMPAVAGNSDIGFGFGAVGTMTRFSPDRAPHGWKLTALIFMTVKEAADGGTELPYHDDWIKLDLPGLADGRLRLGLKLSFGRFTTTGYYGMGNAAPYFEERLETQPRYYQYDHILTGLAGAARLEIYSRLQLMAGAKAVYDWVNIYQDSLLEQDLRVGDAETRELLRGAEDHFTAQMELGFVWDSRDHEFVPTRGMFHEISWRFAPGTTAGSNTAYGGLNLTGRFYQAIWGERLVFAARLLLDMLVGLPPFFELANHGGLDPAGSVGGGWGVRGVPLQRYHGKVKLLTNVELRAKLLPFSVLGQRFNLGVVAFTDAGRVWADWSSPPHLDGSGVGIKVGLGGGLRLQWGEAFLIRADVAWSPDARPVGFYVDVFHVF